MAFGFGSSSFLPAAEAGAGYRSKKTAFLQAASGRRGSQNSDRPDWHRPVQHRTRRRDPTQLPEWLRQGEHVGYTSRSTGKVMEVIVEKISLVEGLVRIIFVEDRSIWKHIPFSLIASSANPMVPLVAPSCKSQVALVSRTNKPGDAINADNLGAADSQAPEFDNDEPELQMPPTPVPLIGGTTSKAIPDSNITASSYFMNNPRYGFGQTWRVRIDNTDSAWRAKSDDFKQCVRFDFQGPHQIMSVQTKGNFIEGHWVTEYKLSYSLDGKSWKWLDGLFDGNRDQGTVKSNTIGPPVVASMLRLHPTGWHEHISMRVEVLGFRLPEEAAPVESCGEVACQDRGRSRSLRREGKVASLTES